MLTVFMDAVAAEKGILVLDMFVRRVSRSCFNVTIHKPIYYFKREITRSPCITMT